MKKLREKLKTFRQRLLIDLDSNLSSENPEEVKKNLELIGTLDNVSKNLEDRNRKLAITLAVCVLCLLLVTASFMIRWHTANFKANLDVTGLRLELAEDWELSRPLSFQELYANGITSVESYGLNFSTPDAKVLSIAVKSKTKSYLTNVNIAAGAYISMNSEAGNTELVITKGSSELNVMLNPKDTAEIRGDKILNVINKSTNSEYIKIVVDTDRSGIFQLDLSSVPLWRFSDMHILDVHFNKDVAIANDEILNESTIIRGKIYLVETEDKIEFSEREIVTFEEPKIKRIVISSAHDHLNIMIEGEAEDVVAGISGFEESLKPSFAEYAFRQQKIAFFYTALLFVWGLFWSIKKLITGKPSGYE